jgi:hypothetical protein
MWNRNQSKKPEIFESLHRFTQRLPETQRGPLNVALFSKALPTIWFKNGLYPAKQLPADDAAGLAANQTNLGLAAFGELTYQRNYTTMGQPFARTIYNDDLGTDEAKSHFTLQYGDDASWTTAFNLSLIIL